MNIFEICKLNQKQYRLLYSKDQKKFIGEMPELEGGEWDSKLEYPPWRHGDGVKIDNLKNYIKDALKESQGLYCAYCGLELELTSASQIEHIAPKGNGRYPKFMFHSCNLTLACSLCNGFEKKEKREHFKTIGVLKTKYEDCYFNIVHPYLDDPTEHFDLSRDGEGITISSLSLKGQKSIVVFKLDEEPQTNARGEHLKKYLYNIDPKYKQAYEDACNRIGV